MTIQELTNDYNWQSAFSEASCNRQTTLRTQGKKFADFAITDVAKIIHLQNGDNDGPDWIGVFELKDGRFIFISAGCDYTGWDCQASGYSVFSDRLNDLMRYGVNQDARERFGVTLK